MIESEDILAFWFPPGLDADEDAHRGLFQFWFRGGANEGIVRRFAATHDAAMQDALDAWADTPRGRLALIIVLDQFSRSLHGGTALAYAQDSKAVALADDGLKRGFYDALATVWEKTFFMLPLGHSERLADLDRCIALADALIPEAPPQVRALYEFSASQARGHRAVLARFGRQPHRNVALGRASTAEELEYLAAGKFVHQRSFAG
ncbi:MAG TPA: DUF924 family protein [Dongiaceae bacterium]|nr:DUF924 family protein [Dongiaceae bacterium]